MNLYDTTDKDPFEGDRARAKVSQWIKDLSPRKRGLGLVKEINEDTYGMNVFWIKSKKTLWTIWPNHGHYIVI